MSQPARASSQPPLPQEAYQYADRYQLGTPGAVYRVLYRGSITLGIICLLLAGLFVAVVTSGESTGISMVFMLLLALLCVVGAVYYLALHPLLHGSWRIYSCTDGFVFLKGSQAAACRWDQVAFVWQRIVAYYSYGVRSGTSYKYTVQRSAGARIVITQMFRNVDQLGAQLQREVTNRLAPQALAAVQAGQTLPFGRFSLSPQGLVTSREIIPWSAVQEVKVSSGWLMIQRRGSPRGTSYGRVDTIPNLYVFLRVAEALSKGPG